MKPSPGEHQSLSFAMPVGRPMRVVVVADTHSRPHPDSLEQIAAEQPDLILHGGDIGSLDVIDRLDAIAPTVAVRGNIDASGPGLPDTVDITLHRDEQPMLVMLLRHIAVRGPKLRADAARQAVEHGAAMVVCGHSHVPFIGRDRDLLVFNPGSIGPRRFGLPITFGRMTVGAERLDMRHVDCETGESWLP